MKKIPLLATLGWLLLVTISYFWAISNNQREHDQLALATARAFLQQIIIDRAWNAGHCGVYVPVTATTPPNPYLIDPLRDLETTAGLKLTKINPAFMTRQIAEIAAKSKGVMFHITSLNPIRPENKPFDWEMDWLRSFEKGVQEQGRFTTENGIQTFRYMAPLVTEPDCLQCHGGQGYKVGDIRGGISVTLPYFTPPNTGPFRIRHGVAALLGTLIIFISAHLLKRSKEALVHANNDLSTEIKIRINAETEQTKLIASLQAALAEIKTLQGIIPICAHCGQIRDEHESWKRMEEYISSHSEAKFSHGVCPDCAKKYYAEFLGTDAPDT